MCAILTRAPPGALPELTTSGPLARGAAFRGRPDQFLSRASHLRCSPATCLSLSFCQKMFRCNLVVGLSVLRCESCFPRFNAARPVFSPDRLTSGLSYPLYCPPVWVCVCVSKLHLVTLMLALVNITVCIPNFQRSRVFLQQPQLVPRFAFNWAGWVGLE